MSDLSARIANLSPLKQELLIRELEHQSGRSQRSDIDITEDVVVTIKPGRKERPFFCIHPVGGEVASYVELARHLDWKRPFCGVRAGGLGAVDVPHDTVEAMASFYIDRIRRHQEDGPYFIGGWSMGGLVAFEMACQLQAGGYDVEGLILIDSALPSDGKVKRGEFRSSQILMAFATDLWGRADAAVPFNVEDLEKYREIEQQLERLLEQGIKDGVLRRNTDVAQLARMFHVCRCNYAAMQHYETKHRFNGNALILLASERPKGKNELAAVCWREYIDGEADLHEVAGDHFSMVREPHVQTLSRSINEFTQKYGLGTNG